MADALRRFVSRLSPDGAVLFLAQADLVVAVEQTSRRQRTSRLVRAVLEAGDEKRDLLEAIAGHIMALADQTENAERALRAVCEGESELIKHLETERSLEEQILELVTAPTADV